MKGELPFVYCFLFSNFARQAQAWRAEQGGTRPDPLMSVSLSPSRAFQAGTAPGLAGMGNMINPCPRPKPHPPRWDHRGRVRRGEPRERGSRESAATATQLMTRLARGHARDNYGFIDRATGEAEFCVLVVVCSWLMLVSVPPWAPRHARCLRHQAP